MRLSRMTVADTVKVENSITYSFTVKNGLRQGGPLSTVLFNFILESVIWKGEMQRKRASVYSRSHQSIAFAGDMVILVQTKPKLGRVILKLGDAARTVGLEVNFE